MAKNYPTTIDDSTTLPVEADDVSLATNHPENHTNSREILIAIEEKLGVDSSTDTDSIDYKLKNTSSVSPGHKHEISDNTDVDTSGATDGQLLSYNDSASEWQPSTSTTPDASTTVKGKAKLATAPASASDPIAIGDNDTRVPVQGENDAMVGTSGTPSSTNKYVTNDDVTEAKTASKIPRRDSNSDILVATTPIDGDAATSKTYVDSVNLGHKANKTFKTLADADATQTITHGLGKVPNFVSLTGATLQTSIIMYSTGSYDGTTNTCLYYFGGTGGSVAASNTFSIRIYGDATSKYQTGVITVDSTNISIAWTKTSTPTGTASIIWEAHG